MARASSIEIEGYSADYGGFLGEMRREVEEFLANGSLSRARELSERTGQHFNHSQPPQFFTGDPDASFVLVHLNPKANANDDRARFLGKLPFADFEEYFDLYRHFGARMYGASSPRTHRSPFDHKQIRFLKPFGVIDFVEERSRTDRFTNLERAVDRKLQLELIPYPSVAFSATGFSGDVLAPHFVRIMDVIAARPRDYVIFCGAVFAKLLADRVVDAEVFHLRKADGTPERQSSRFATLRLQHNGQAITAGLAYSWARQAIPMTSYAEEIKARYGTKG